MSRHRVALKLGVLLPLLLVVALLGDERTAHERSPTIGESERRTVRRPVALSATSDGTRVLVAQRRGAAVSLVDCVQVRVIDELPLEVELESLVELPRRHGDSEISSQRWLAVGRDKQGDGREIGERSQVVEIALRGDRLSKVASNSAVRSAQSIVIDHAGRRAFVAGLWSHGWQAIELDRRPVSDDSLRNSRPGKMLRLPFAAREQCVLPDDRHVLVADAFGGELALVDANESRVVRQWKTAGHQIRGLRLSLDRKFVEWVQQRQDETLPVDREQVSSRKLMRSQTARIAVESLLATPPTSPTLSVETHDVLGADLSDQVWLGETSCIASAGTNELLIERTRGGEVSRVLVGARPLALARLGDARRVAVVNSLDDSLTIVDVDHDPQSKTISLGPRPPESPQERGERLFFDARLSVAGAMSCHSCHVEGHSNGLLADTLGDDGSGNPKRTLTLLGTGLTYRWAWNGTQANLHDQVLKSLDQTLHGSGATFQHATDLVAYLHSLPPPPPVAREPVDAVDAERMRRGARVFESRQCGLCHIPPLVFTSHESYDVGLSDERGLRKFNPPSLRGASQLPRLLHDNRAASLKEVFTKHAHPNDATYSAEEVEALVRYLEAI